MAEPPDPRHRRVEAWLRPVAAGVPGARLVSGVGATDSWFHDQVADALAGTDRVVIELGARRHERSRPLGVFEPWLPAIRIDDALDSLIESVGTRTALVVTDAQWLHPTGAELLASLGARADGLDLLLILATPAPAASLDPALVTLGVDVLDIARYSDAELEQVLAATTGEADPRVAAALARRTALDPGLVQAFCAHLATADRDDRPDIAESELPAPVRDLIIDRTRRLDVTTLELLEVESIVADDPALVCAIAGVSPDALRETAAAAAAEGLTHQGSLVELAATAVAEDLDTARRTELAAAVLHHAGDRPSTWLAARLERLAPGSEAAAVFVDAAATTLFEDPAHALTWLDHAARLDGAAGGPLRAAALALTGRHDDALRAGAALATEEDAEGLGNAAQGLAYASGGHYRTAAESYAAGPAGWPTLVAVPAATMMPPVPADLEPAAANVAVGEHPAAAAFLAAVTSNTSDALTVAAQVVGPHDPVGLWPDSPHAVLAMDLIASGRGDDAETWLTDAIDIGLGGPDATRRHRLLRGWAGLRIGKWAVASDALSDTNHNALARRDRLLAVALDLAVAARHADAAAIDATAPMAIDLLRQVPLSRTALDPMLEIGAVLAPHLGPDRVSALVGQAIELADACGGPWPDWAAFMAAIIASRSGNPRAPSPVTDPALGAAIAALDQVANGTVDTDAVESATAQLRDRGLASEAAHLAGVAGSAATDPATASRLLDLARVTRQLLPASGATEAEGYGALSDRQKEVAELVVDGHSYKEIGARLFISAKTVEHHVAAIRGKLGAESRAEMLQMLRASTG